MKLPLNLVHQCHPFHRILLNGTNQTSSRFLLFYRIFHCGLFMKENTLCKRNHLLRNVNVAEVVKRSATKKAKAKKKGASGLKADLSIGSEIIDMKGIQDDMVNATRKLSEEFQRKYSTRLTSNTLDNIRVTINGTVSSLYEVAEVKSRDQEFMITPMTEGKEDEQILLKAIQRSLNVDPLLDGTVIRIPVSVASSEYKQNIMKLAKSSAEKCKAEIRKIRQESIVKVKKHPGSVSKDTTRLIEKQIQLLTDAHNQEVESILSKKALELSPAKK